MITLVAFLRAIFIILALSTTSFLAFVSGSILVQIHGARRALNEFKRKTNGMLMADEEDRSMICNHSLNSVKKDMLQGISQFLTLHKARNYGWLFQDKFGVTTIDAELMKRIVLDEPNKNINRTKMNGPGTEFIDDSLSQVEDEQWRRLRRAVAPALRPAKFKAPNVVREIESSIDKFIGAIENKLSASHEHSKLQATTIKADDLLHRFTLDVVFRCFYKQHDLIDFNAPQCRWTELVDEGTEACTSNPIYKLGLMIDALRKPLDWLLVNWSRQGKWRAEIIDFVRRQTEVSLRARKELEEAKAKGIQVDADNFVMKDGSRFRRNMADHIADHLLDGKISQREYFNTSSFLITAGDKTVLDSLVYTLYQLAIDVDGVQHKLRESIEQDGAESVYLDWVLSESLRLMPPASVACSRTVVEDMEIEDGKLIPAGTFVSYPGYVVHRLKEYWGEDAEEFKPERWHDTSHHHPLQYVPFGAGVRQCPGREFALFEMKEFLSRLLPRYKFYCEPKADIGEFHAPFLSFIVPNSPTFIEITRI